MNHMTHLSERPESIALSVKDLSLKYGNQWAFKNLSLFIPSQSVTAIIGPSGCGKTSFLNCLNRMTDLFENCHVEGAVSLQGKNIYAKDMNVTELRKRIGMIFQKPNPFPTSIARNLLMPLKYHGIGNRKIRKEIMQHSLEEVGLWEEVKDRLDESALKLSGGQQQRLCIARAIALEPEIILMDEPCSALDPLSSGKVETLIKNLKEHFTVIVVTHNLAQAKRISQQTAVFWNRGGEGQLIEYGPTERIFGRATHTITEAYVSGHMG